MRFIVQKLDLRGLPDEALVELQRLPPEAALRWAHTHAPINLIRIGAACAELSRSLAPLKQRRSKVPQLRAGDEALIMTPKRRDGIRSILDVEFTLITLRVIK